MFRNYKKLKNEAYKNYFKNCHFTPTSSDGNFFLKCQKLFVLEGEHFTAPYGVFRRQVSKTFCFSIYLVFNDLC